MQHCSDFHRSNAVAIVTMHHIIARMTYRQSSKGNRISQQAKTAEVDTVRLLPHVSFCLRCERGEVVICCAPVCVWNRRKAVPLPRSNGIETVCGWNGVLRANVCAELTRLQSRWAFCGPGATLSIVICNEVRLLGQAKFMLIAIYTKRESTVISIYVNVSNQCTHHCG